MSANSEKFEALQSILLRMDGELDIINLKINRIEIDLQFIHAFKNKLLDNLEVLKKSNVVVNINRYKELQETLRDTEGTAKYSAKELNTLIATKEKIQEKYRIIMDECEDILIKEYGKNIFEFRKPQ